LSENYFDFNLVPTGMPTLDVLYEVTLPFVEFLADMVWENSIIGISTISGALVFGYLGGKLGERIHYTKT